jgi:hypothetical protein
MGETTLADVESALVNASNYLNEIESVRDASRFHALDAAIDTALRLVQAWIDAETA